MHVLLTGAGFTKNFGGFLGEEMWLKVFNKPVIQRTPSIRSFLLQEPLDYENAYQTVMDNPSLDRSEKAARQQAVMEAYEDLDATVIQWYSQADKNYPINGTQVNYFINRFAQSNGGKGFFFTTNQDLFIERKYQNEPRPRLTPLQYLGVDKPLVFDDLKRSRPLSRDDHFALPDIDDAAKKVRQCGRVMRDTCADVLLCSVGQSDGSFMAPFCAKSEIMKKGGFFLVKLHGSFNWKSADGNRLLITGKRKHPIIESSPHLKWYLDTFKGVLMQGNSRLLTPSLDAGFVIII